MDDLERHIEVELNRLRGRLCGLIESWGLARDPGGASREAGMKSTLKHLTYESQRELTDFVRASQE